MKAISFLTGVFVLCTLLPAQTTRPVEELKRVCIISIDGLRPDLLLRADAPNLRGLMKSGTFTMWATTTDVAVTLPSHVSMTTGVVPQTHRIHWNDDVRADELYYPASPTLFELAHERGLSTAVIAGKSKLVAISPPETLDWTYLADEGPEDSKVATKAADVIRAHRPYVMLIHFGQVDGYGHGNGWGSDEQIAAVERADACVGQVLCAMDEAGVADATAVILSADHGGAGFTHGGPDPRSQHIPWIIRGPGIRENYDLTRLPEVTVNTTDTFATACYLLGIDVTHPIDGKPIKQILAERELLEPAAPATEPSTQP